MITALLTTTLLLLAQPTDPLVGPAASPASSAVRLVDLTGDGLLDLLHMHADGISVSINRDAGLFDAIPQQLPAVRLADALASDLDGDGLVDLYLVSPAENVALLGDGTGHFIEATERLGLADTGRGVSAERVALDSFGEDELLLHNVAGDVIFWATGHGFRRDARTPVGPRVGNPGDQTIAGGTGHLVTDNEKRILSHMSLVHLDDGTGSLVNRTIRISGANLQIVNGLGSTNGYPADPDEIDPGLTTVNGVGNLIVGYNEGDNPKGDARTGSHNVVLGHGNSYTSFGGLIGSMDNTVSGPFASVSGGLRNTASANWSSVSGGLANTAAGSSSSVGGGFSNEASGGVSSVSGGYLNTASGYFSSVVGGQANTASGFTSSVSGGISNEAGGYHSSVSGGSSRAAAGTEDWVAGALFEDN